MLDLLFGRPRQRADDGWERGWTSGRARTRTNAGVQVDEDLALTYSAVFCATRVIAETAASLPLLTYRRLNEHDREVASDHPNYDLLKCEPSTGMGSMAFREGRTMHQVNWGNGFAEIERDAQDRVLALHPIHPGRIRPVRPGDTDRAGRPLAGRFRYLVRNDDGSSLALRASEVLHVPGALSEDGIWGKGIIAHARESVGFGLATERFGAGYFGSGAQPRGIVYGPGMKDKESRANFRAEWKQIHGSPDSGEIAILPIESKYDRITLTNEDSQFLATRGYNVREIARWYRLPAYMLMEYEKAATYASVEALGLEFVIYSLLPWLRRWEEQLNLKLFTKEERREYYTEHQLAGLLRGDVKSRYAGYQVAFTHGWLTLNEIRRMENLPSMGPDGDRHFVPLNLGPIDQVVAMQLPTDPPGPRPPADDDEAVQAFDAFARRYAGLWHRRRAWVAGGFTKEGNGHA